MRVFCCICEKEIEPILVTGKDIYPCRKDLYELRFYQCLDCNGYVGTHKDGRPLGYIVNNEVKKMRIRIHNLIDPIWKSRKMKREEVYKKLSDFCGRQFHTGSILSMDEAWKIYNYCKENL